jgi:5-methylthioribose kinase
MISILYDEKKKITRTGTQPISRLFEWFAPKFQKVVDDELVNTELRTLNYEHILNILLKKKMDSTLILDGLQELALPYKKDVELKKTLSD